LIVNNIFDFQRKFAKLYAYADDITLVVKGKDMSHTVDKAQHVVNKLVTWSRINKLEFYSKKTVMMNLTRVKTKIPEIFFNNRPIPLTSHVKILGIIIDNKLTWKKHIAYATCKAERVTNIITRVAGKQWGLTGDVALHLSNMCYETIITYAASIWGYAAKKKYIENMINAGQRRILIKCFKGYRTTSLKAMQSFAGVYPLNLTVRWMHDVYASKVLDDKTFNDKVEKPYPLKDMLHPKEWKHINYYTISTNNIYKKDSFWDYYTDGSKGIKGTGGAFVLIDHTDAVKNTRKYYLSSDCNVYQAEIFAIVQALKHANYNCDRNIRIFSDSMSSLESICNYHNYNTLAMEARSLIINLKKRNRKILMFWIKGHSGLRGNELADQAAKTAANKEEENLHYDKLTIRQMKKKLKILLHDNWYKSYNSYNNTWFKKFFPYVSESSPLPYYVPEVLWVVTGHGSFLEYLYRIKRKNTAYCPCGKNDTQTPHHLLWNCYLTAESIDIRKLRSRPFISYTELLTNAYDLFARSCKFICKICKAKNSVAL